jgi:hypothetical protein
MAKLFIYGLEFDTKLLESQGIEVQRVIDDLFDLEDLCTKASSNLHNNYKFSIPITFTDSINGYCYNFENNKYIDYTLTTKSPFSIVTSTNNEILLLDTNLSIDKQNDLIKTLLEKNNIEYRLLTGNPKVGDVFEINISKLSEVQTKQLKRILKIKIMETIYGVEYNPKLLAKYDITHETMLNDLEPYKGKLLALGSKNESAKITTEGGTYVIEKGVLISIEK